MNRLLIITLACCCAALPVQAHQETAAAALAALAAKNQARQDASNEREERTARLTVRLIDAATQKPLPATVRVQSLTDKGYWQPIDLNAPLVFFRSGDWYSLTSGTALDVKPDRFRVEAFGGLGWGWASAEIDLRNQQSAEITLPLKRFEDSRSSGWYSGNTHLHLMNLTRDYADQYLHVVPEADDLSLLFVSHLEYADQTPTYVTNQYSKKTLQALSTETVTLGYGEEHRHNFPDDRRASYIPYPTEGYGHVMFLDIDELVQPVSLGPFMTDQQTDEIPLRRGINQALKQDATVIWCHESYGTEDLPNWLEQKIHAQNIFDNEVRDDNAHYEETFYRYLDIGLKVPFSTGTDWFMHDQTMAYARLDEPLTAESWLKALRAGRSYITNGPLLSLTIGESEERREIGDTISLEQPARRTVKARAVGRNDFLGLELIYNGTIVYLARSVAVDGHYEATMEFPLQLDESGWVAVRLPWTNNRNELGAIMRGHTSPIYIEVGGQQRFDANVAHGLLEEMRDSMRFIKSKAIVKKPDDLNEVLGVYTSAIETLQRRIAQDR